MKRSPDAVRRSVERLAARGFLRRRQAREGTLQGVVFCLVPDLLCPHIRCAGSPVQVGVHPGVRPDPVPAPSLLEKIDRENLSISSERALGRQALLEALTDEDVAFHWPELARTGFGTFQIRQIIERRAQVGEGVEHVMQGLVYAEWELARQCMKTHKGEPVSAPLNWVYKILATQGYYPRPQGYATPAGQADRDREEDTRREMEAREALFLAASEAWAANLTPDERAAILKPGSGAKSFMPEAVLLRTHFRQHVWPQMREGGPNT